MSYIQRLRIYDIALSYFKNCESKSFNQLYTEHAPSDFNSVFEYLQSEGFVKISKYGIEITEKGKLKIRSGGFVRAFIVRNVIVAISILAAIASIFSAGVLLY